MLGLLMLLLPLVAEPTAAPALHQIPAEYVGRATEPGACSGPLVDKGIGVSGRFADKLIVGWTEPPRIGGCDVVHVPVIKQVTLATGRMEPLAGAPQKTIAVADSVVSRCVTREALRPYHSLALLGGALEGLAVEITPGRSLVTARLIDARKSPATVHLLGKIGARTLEVCDRTEVAEGHCPNPTHGDIRQVTLVDDRLVITLGVGLADVCGQDDLVIKVFPLPAEVRRSLR